MDDTQLDLGQPIYSARRFPSIPVHKSELKSGPLRSPGTVPFRWEKSPGQPKAAASDSMESSFEDCITEELLSTTASTCLEDDGEGEAYVDAPETLSRTESFFFNCSLGGLSGLDGADVLPFGTLSADPKIQDLMMGRFLPAAQAMAAETPTHINRKQPSKLEEPRCIGRVRNTTRQLRYEQCMQGLSPNYAPELYRVETTDDEDDDGDGCELEDHVMKGCGFLSRFCVKNSFGLMNTVPDTKLKAGNTIAKLHTQSSNKPLSTWLKQRSAGAGQPRNSKLKNFDLALSYSEGSPKPEDSPLPTKFEAHLPRFLHNEGHTGLSEADRKRKNDFIPQEKTLTSFRDLLALDNDARDSDSVLPAVEKTLHVDRMCSLTSVLNLDTDFSGLTGPPEGRESESELTANKSKADYRNVAAVNRESWIRHSSRQHRNIDMNGFRGSETPERSNGLGAHHKITLIMQENSDSDCSNLPRSPPLPNSPSESWLTRTLPFTSSPRRSLLGRFPGLDKSQPSS